MMNEDDNNMDEEEARGQEQPDNNNNNNNNNEDEFAPHPGDGPRDTDWAPEPYTKNFLFPRNRLYLYDRTRGASRYRGFHGKPICCICYVPVPVYKCSPLCEQNCACDKVGSVGCVDSEDIKRRRCLMGTGLVANFLSMFLMIFACFALADDNFDLLSAAPFAEGTMKLVGENESAAIAKLHLGFRAVALEVAPEALGNNAANLQDGQTLITWDDMCNSVGDTLSIFDNPDSCGECQEQSQRFVISVLLAAILCLPSIFTNYLRLYPNYDANCQKAFGWLVTIFSVANTLRALYGYASSCTNSFYSGRLDYQGNFTGFRDDVVIDPSTIELDVQWEHGVAFLAMAAGTIIRMVDAVVSAILPTPTITRDRKEQDAYEERYLPVSPQKRKKKAKDNNNPAQTDDSNDDN